MKTLSIHLNGHRLGPFMRVIILSSGGKDSALAAWWAICKGWDITCMITIKVSGDDSWMFQLNGTEVAELQAKAIGCDWRCITVSGEQEVEVKQLEYSLSQMQGEYDALISGALASEYQRRRIELMAERLGVISYTPLWHNDSLQHMRELVECGIEMMLVSVSCEGLDEDFLGRQIDAQLLARMERIAHEYRFSIDGEGGEFETIITAGPHMKRKIEITGTKDWKGSHGNFIIDSAILR